MKKLLIAACMFLGVTGFVTAQQPAPKTTTTTSTSAKKTTGGKVVQMDNTKPVAKNGLKADGTPDMRLKENKMKAASVPVTGPTKKDGSADMRYKANKKKG